MRHTLIPTNLKKALRHEYHIRALVVLLFMLSVSGIIGIVSMMPAFVYVKTESDNISKTLSALQKSAGNIDGKNIDNDAAKQDNILALFNDQSKGKTNNSTIIDSIISVRGNVRITSLAISRTGSTTIVVTIQGVAPTRDSLINFKNQLATVTPGNKIDLPISALAKSKDIQYSLTLTNEKMP